MLMATSTSAANYDRKDNVIVKQTQSIGSSAPANSKSLLDMVSTTKGVLAPRMTTTQRDAITSVPEALSIYNSTTHFPNFYNGSAWKEIVDASSTQTITGKSMSGSSNTFTNIPLSAFTNLGTTTTVLHGNAAGSPTFGAVALSTDVSGALPIANGGTNNASLAVTAGGMLYTDGSKIVNMGSGSAGQVPVSTGSGAPSWGVTQGGLIGDRELITNTNLEVNATGWNAYSDSAGNAPVDGTGGSPNTTCTRDTGTPITGTGSLLITKAGSANRQGEGCSSDVTIGVADRNQTLQIELDYRVASGTFTNATSFTADSDIEVYFYDISNSILLPVSEKRLYWSSVNDSTHYIATFKTSSNTATGRLIFHTASTTTNNFTIDIDNISMHPYSTLNVSQVTDWVNASTNTITATTSSPTKGTVTNEALWYRRVGSNLEVRVEYNQTAAGSGANGTGDYLWLIPGGFQVDTAKVTVYTTAIGNAQLLPLNTVGTSYLGSSGPSAQNLTGGVYVYDSTHVRFGGHVLNSNATTGGTYMMGASWGGLASTTVKVVAVYSVPILGWSASSAAVMPEQSNFGWTDGGAITFTATSGGAVKGTTTRDKIWYRRNGENLDVRIEYKQTATGTAGTGDYTILIPGGYTVDTTKVLANSTVYGAASQPYLEANLGPAWVGCGAPALGSGLVGLYDSTHVRIAMNMTNSTADAFSAGACSFGQTTLVVSASFSVPILGWTENQRAPQLVGLYPNPVSVSATYNAQVFDYIYASGASFTITLPSAIGVKGQGITIEHNGTSLSQVYTLNTTSSQTINGPGGTVASGNYALYTNGEKVDLISDGANWRVKNHHTDTGPISLGGLTVSASSAYVFTVTAANATIGAVYSNNGFQFTVTTTITGTTTLTCSGTGTPGTSGSLVKVSGTGDATITFSSRTITGVPAFGSVTQNATTVVRNGKYATFEWRASFGSGTDGSGNFIFYLPAGLAFDTSIVPALTTLAPALDNNIVPPSGLPTYAYFTRGNGSNVYVMNTSSVIPYSSTSFRIISSVSFGGGTSGIFGSGSFGLGTAAAYYLSVTFPVSGWQP